MAGEYVRWLARDVKPEEKRELTPREKRRNWWEYHRWYVLGGLIFLLLAGNAFHNAVRTNRNLPDYTVAYVGQAAMPEELELIIEAGLAQLGEDRNGNGEVRVELRQFVTGVTPDGYASSMALVTSIETNESMIFLLEDPALFHGSYPVLSMPDGTEPGDDGQPWLRWGDCPALAELPLEGIGTQEILANLSIARRGVWDREDDERIVSALELWERMTDGVR